MMHTAACNIRNPAYRHKTYTPAPISSAAENVTVKAITSLHHRLPGTGSGCYPASKPRRVFPRSQPDPNRPFSPPPRPAVARPPHLHLSPLPHPVTLRPLLFTPPPRSLSIR